MNEPMRTFFFLYFTGYEPCLLKGMPIVQFGIAVMVWGSKTSVEGAIDERKRNKHKDL